MDFLLDSFLSYLLLYKYLALFLIILTGAIYLPIPTASTVMAAAAFASQGYMNLTYVIIVACTAYILGDIIGYFIAKKFGKPILYKMRLGKLLHSRIFKVIEDQIVIRPFFSLFLTRFQIQADQIGNILAGLNNFPLKRFLLFISVGQVVQVLCFAVLGFIFGQYWKEIADLTSQFGYIVLVIFLLLIVLRWSHVRKKHKPHEAAEK